MPKRTRSNSASAMGERFGKRDIERIGVFSENGWLHGVPHTSPKSYEFRPGAAKGNQMLIEGPKVKAGLQDCYFEKGPYKRIFEKEAYSSAIREGYMRSMAASKQNFSSQAFLAGAPSKSHSTPGDFYGTFSGKIAAMSREEKSRPPHKHEPRNMQTNPGKKGTSGYVDITFSRFPIYMPQGYPSRSGSTAKIRNTLLGGPLVSMRYPQAYFDSNPWRVEKATSTYVKRMLRKPGYQGQVWMPPHVPKQPGNNHDGCFSNFPSHKPEAYIDSFRIMRGPREAEVFFPQTRNKTKYTCSIMNQNVDFRMNAKNWRTFQPVTYKCKVLQDKSK